MITFALNPRSKTMDIIKDGTIVESVPTSAPLAEREARLVAHGYVAGKPESSRQAARREAAQRGNTGGWGQSRSRRS